MLNKYGRLITKGPKKGYCNICNTFGDLTEDHVPPKGSVLIGQVEMLHIIDLLNSEKPTKSKRLSQDGVKFRSLCSNCNNNLLGSKYDPSLIDFTNQVANYLKSSLTLPEIATVKIKPGLVARAVLGHLLALGVNRAEKGEMGEEIINFILDTTSSFPESMNIYYWIYPYKRQVLIRDAGMMVKMGAAFSVIWVMKYFPLGFLITWQQPENLSFNLVNLKEYALVSGSALVDVPLKLTNIPPQHFPENPGSEGVVLYGQGAMGANPVQSKQKTKLTSPSS